MKYIENELSVYFDCDNTLIMRNDIDKNNYIRITSPYTNREVVVSPHLEHIDLLKEQKARGYYVVVWSHGGAAWSKAVVEALQLEEFVDEVRVKPSKYFDDLQANEVLGTRVYLEYKPVDIFYVKKS